MDGVMTTLEAPPQPQQQPQPTQLQLHRVSTCERHPEEHVTGFCASCLRERLAGLDTGARSNRASSSSSSSALKSIFFKGGLNHATGASSKFLPELRRCKSFSCGRGDGSHGPPPAAAFEPQRKSCDVRGRNTLWSLFHLDDQDSSIGATGGGGIEMECRNLGFLPGVAAAPVLETREEDEEEEEEFVEEEEEEEAEEEEDGCEITVVPVEETKEIIRDEEELRSIKDHIDLDSHTRKPPPKDLKEIAGSFWVAASVFSKKLQKWRRKQKLKKQCGSKSTVAMNSEKPSKSRRFRETQSEIALDMFGRRSCDTDPRFSLDAGRISFDDPRQSWDEPRASWDGYLIGGRSTVPRFPPMLSVVEDVAVAATPSVPRADGQIPVEEDATPGGSSQTRDYYSDSSQRRRKSLDRSSSFRKSSSVEMEEPKPVSNPAAAKVNNNVSHAAGSDFFHHVNKLEKDLRDSNSNYSLREEERCESFEAAYRDPPKVDHTKKSWRWGKAWSIWGFIHRGRSNNRGSLVERSFSESWPELRREEYDGKILRSNSSVSSRHSINHGNPGSMRRSNLPAQGKRREEIVLERNRSARYSPSHIDSGMLRFYLTPMQNSRRGNGSGKGKHHSSNSFTRSVLRLY